MEGYSDKEITEWKTEFDVVSTLQEMGHEVYPLGVFDDLGQIRKALDDIKPHVAFNLLEEFHGQSLFDYHITSYLELLKQPYTGCNPRGLMVAHDKALSKKIMTYHRIRTPKFTVYPMSPKIKISKRLNYPLFVKSLYEEGSYGISHASIVSNEEKLYERISYLHDQLRTPVISEEYIEGREIYIPVVGNSRLRVMPPMELEFGSMPEKIPRIATSKVKWDWAYQKQYGIDIKPAELDNKQMERVIKLGKRLYHVLGLSGYARIDIRLTEGGKIYVLEANANPDIAYGGEMSTAAELGNMSYEEFLQKVINLGMRYSPDIRNT
jgi:D-alanine-D-alanine ligase